MKGKEEINRNVADAGTPLFIAAQNGFKDVVKWLLACGEQIDTKLWWHGNHKTAAEQANMKGHAVIMEVGSDFCPPFSLFCLLQQLTLPCFLILLQLLIRFEGDREAT